MLAKNLDSHDIKITKDGSFTVFSKRYNQNYGSLHGSFTQSKHVFVEASNLLLQNNPNILEIGFGIGQNFRTTLELKKDHFNYLAYEFDPINIEILNELTIKSNFNNKIWQECLEQWGQNIIINDKDLQINVEIKIDDARNINIKNWANIAFLDAFSPQANPELWNTDFLNKIFVAMQEKGSLVTYSSASKVRKALLEVGFIVEKLQGPNGKREILRAVK